MTANRTRHFHLPGEGKSEREGERERRQAQRALDVRSLMKEPWGRRLVMGLLEATGVESTTFTGNSEGFRLEGRRQVGLEVLREVKAQAFDQYINMLKEQSLNE